MTTYPEIQVALPAGPRRWLITGAAGFIGSHLVETLLRLDQAVVALDNFATGHRQNLEQVRDLVSATQWARYTFIEGDITQLDTCRRACAGADYVLHQAALGSVPRSVADPVTSHDSNVSGFLNLLLAARDAQVKRLVYASSSAVYGDDPDLPKVEDKVGNVLSPTPRPRSSTRFTPTSSRAPTASRPSACATSTSSARAKTPTARMRR